MNELKLYEIADSIRAILNAEEWTDETVSALEQCELSLTEKVGSIAEIIRQAEASAEICKAEEKRIAAIRKAREGKSEWLKNYLLSALQQADREEIAIGTRTVRLRKNPHAVCVDDESAIPAKYYTIIPETKQLDKSRLAADLKSGEVPGAHLTQGVRVEIK